MNEVGHQVGHGSFGQQKRAGFPCPLSYESNMVPKIGVEPALP